MVRLPPTSADLVKPDCRPYFLWWTNATTTDLRQHLASDDPAVRAYWLGALLREANSRDVWLFVTPEKIRKNWTHVWRHLGRRRRLWAYLLDLPEPVPPGSRLASHEP